MTDTDAGTAVAEFERMQHVEHNPLEFFINRYDDFSRMSAQLAKSGMFRHTTGQAVGAILLYALEMGIPVTHALRGMYHIPGGSLGMEGQLMLGLARNRCGVTIKKDSITRTRKKYAAILCRGEEEVPCEFTADQAVTAKLLAKNDDGTYYAPKNARGKVKTTWDEWREDMLQWRAISQGLRVIAPDFFLNIYSAEEALAMQAEQVEVHRFDASAELRGEEPTLEDLIEAMQDLVEEVEAKNVGALSFDDRSAIKEAGETFNVEDITGWLKQLKEMLG